MVSNGFIMSELDEVNCLPTSLPVQASLRPPLPPPPPPLPASHLPLQTTPAAYGKNEPAQVPENELESSLEIILSREPKFNKVFFMSNTHLEPQLQDGPKCGLVALSIATSPTENPVEVDSIFQTALSLGFTKQGEMFSAKALALLAEKCCGFKTTLIEGDLRTHLRCIINGLLRKCLLLVPYDTDSNHSPCCKKGTKAHWAVISGFVIIEETGNYDDEEDDHSVLLTTSKCSALCGCLDAGSDLPLIVSADGGRVLVSKGTGGKEGKFKGKSKEGKVYLIGRQGKSRHLGLWPFDDMADSNDNLITVAESRNSESYLVPENGVAEGLKGKAIILE